MPRSHFETADSVTYSFSANSFWVIPSSFRRSRMYSPKVFLLSTAALLSRYSLNTARRAARMAMWTGYAA